MTGPAMATTRPEASVCVSVDWGAVVGHERRAPLMSSDPAMSVVVVRRVRARDGVVTVRPSSR